MISTTDEREGRGPSRLVSVVISCYNSERTIREVVELSMAEFARMDGYDCEFVLVDDCSSDRTFEVIRQLADEHPNVRGASLMRNFGQHNGLMCAMHFAQGDYVLGMDDDLQTHPSQIPALIKRMEEGFDLVYGCYRESLNGSLKRFTSWLNKVTSNKLLGRPEGIRASNFWVISSQVKDQVIRYANYNPNVDALFTRMTRRVANVTIEHHQRAYGSSGYTLAKLARLWLAYFNYTVVPLRIVSAVGVITAGVGFFAGVVTVVRKVLNPGMMAGWASTICVLLFFFGLVLLTLGVIGEYLGNIVLSINSTPQFIVRDKVNL
ncbi:glycosyltransferase family 2 protein [Olsenella massiliensis]|uniref:glycosyltransferase family 2 protein n=1 Tax=Olsenella massiliensis TaxID=1622075 RepID=UPI000AAD37A1|nr:glycosyltransferase family 2 protein [Olsenella massiliensis]